LISIKKRDISSPPTSIRKFVVKQANLPGGKKASSESITGVTPFSSGTNGAEAIGNVA